MLYDEPAAMLRRAGEMMVSGELAALTPAQQRTIGIQLARLGAMWPDMFATLASENEVLTAARDQVAGALDANGHAGRLAVAEDPDDPIERYRHVLCQLNDVLPVLHDARGNEWG